MINSLGFIGLGLMGNAIVERLLGAGYEVMVWNRSKDKINPAVEKGATEASSIAQLASSVDCVFLCLTDSEAVKSVVFGDGGIATVATAGKILVDLSSIRPGVTKSYANRLKVETGMGWIDAPVSGGVKGATEGTLAIMAGGERKDVDLVRPYMSVFSQRFTWMGSSGAGQLTKLCNQIIVASNIAAIAEAVSFAENSGIVDANKLSEALQGGWADSQPFRIMAPRFAARNTQPMLGAANTMLKDLDTVAYVASEIRARIPMTELVRKSLKKLSVLGLGESDIGEIMSLYGKADKK